MRLSSAVAVLSAGTAALLSSTAEALPSLFGGSDGGIGVVVDGGRALQKKGGGGAKKGGGGGKPDDDDGGDAERKRPGRAKRFASEYAVPAPSPIPAPDEAAPPDEKEGGGGDDDEVPEQRGMALDLDGNPIDYDSLYDGLVTEEEMRRGTGPWEEDEEGKELEEKLGSTEDGGVPSEEERRRKKAEAYGAKKGRPEGGQGGGGGGGKKGGKAKAKADKRLLTEGGEYVDYEEGDDEEVLSAEDLSRLHRDRRLTVATASFGDFVPLQCNIDAGIVEGGSPDCSAPVSTLGAGSSLVIPCGQCYTWDLGDTTYADGMHIVGKLVFPPDYQATVSTTHVVVQGELEMSSTLPVSSANAGIKFLLTGTTDVTFTPQGGGCENFGGACPIGKKAFVVAGGRLNIRGMDSGPTWTTLLDLARGQAAPLADGEYDARPTSSYLSTPAPTCHANGDLLRFSDFSGGVGSWTGDKGAFADVDADGNMIVTRRSRTWQGPFMDMTKSLSCIQPGEKYLLTIRYRLDHPTIAAGTRTNCDLNNGNCHYFTSRVEYDAGGWNSGSYYKKGTPRNRDFKYGEWTVMDGLIEFTADEADPTNVYWYVGLVDAEPGVNVTVSNFEITLPDQAYYPADGVDACSELVRGGDGNLHGFNTYPFSKNYGEGTIVKKTEGTNNYFTLDQRPYHWCGIRSYINTKCLQVGLTYTISYKLRVHSTSPVDTYVKFSWQGGSLSHVTQCATQQTIDDDWVECTRDFTVDESLATQPPDGTLYWEIFLSNCDASTSCKADVDYDDLKITQKGGPVEGLLVPSSVAGSWGSGSEIHVTSGSYDTKHSQNAVIDVVTDNGDGTASVSLVGGLGGPVVTEADRPGFGAEVALLSRNLVIEGADEEVDQGGYVQVLHTPDQAQIIEGVELRNMGQLGAMNRYPLQFRYSGSVNGTSVSRNSIVHSHGRCISVEGTNDALLSWNTAYDTAGHCFYLGYESSNNRVERNLGSALNTKINWSNRPTYFDNDPDASAFFAWYMDNDFVGNVAAGSTYEGFRLHPNYHDCKESGQHCAAEYSFNPRKIALGAFEDNVAHTNRHGFYIRDLEQLTVAGETRKPTFVNTKAYKNKETGVYMWASMGCTYLGGAVAENRYGINFDGSEDGTVHDFAISGLSPETAEYLDSIVSPHKMCGGYSGYGQQGLRIQAASRDMFQNHMNRGLDLKNVAFSAFDSPDMCPGSTPIVANGGNLNNKHWNQFTQAQGIAMNHAGPKSIDLCPAVNNGVDDAIIHDLDGSLDPSGASTAASTIVANDDKMTALALSPCTEYADQCIRYCPDMCFRTLTYRTDPDYTASFTLQVTDTATLQTTSTSGKTYDWGGDNWQETFDDFKRHRLFSVSLPAGSGPFTAVFLDESGQEAWPRWYQEWWEPAPACAGAPGPGDVVLTEPAVTAAELDSIVANGDMEGGTTPLCWRHNGAGQVVAAGEGVDGSGALKSNNRNNRWHWHGQYLDARAITENSDKYHYMSAKFKITSKATGLGVSCNPNKGFWDGGCPRGTLRWEYNKDQTAKNGRYFHEYWGDFMRGTVNHDADSLNTMSGIMWRPNRMDKWLKNGGAHNVLLYLEYGAEDWQYTLDDVSIVALNRPGTCDDDMVHNGDFATGDSSYWYWHHGGAHELSMVEGTGGPSDSALKVSNRGWHDVGQRQVIDIGDCYSPGDRIEVTAKYKLEDKNTGAPASCNRNVYGHVSDGCMDVYISQHNTAGAHRNERGGNPVAIAPAIDNLAGEWQTVKGSYRVADTHGETAESYVWFRAGGNFNTIIDDVTVKRIPQTCSNLLMNPTVDESSAHWIELWREHVTTSLVPGAGGSGHALKISNRAHTWAGVYQDMDHRCLVEGEELTITAKFRLLDRNTGEGVDCDSNVRHNPWSETCPSIQIEGNGCNGGNHWYRFWNEKPFFSWDNSTFNDFESSFVVDANLASCSNFVRVYIRDVDTAYDIVMDDLRISPPAQPTDSPTLAPVDNQQQTDAPTVAPVTEAPTATVQSVPAVDSSSTVAAGPIMLERSADLTLLTKIPASGGTPIPIGRSYLSNDWELAAGTTAEDMAVDNPWMCYSVGCQIDLPALEAGEEYRLTTYTYTLAARDQVARLLESGTFGPKMAEVTAMEGAADMDAAASSWVESQMAEEATSHREVFRQNMNMQYDSTMTVATTDRPCDDLSRWRRTAVTRFDNIWTAVHTLSTTALGAGGTGPYSVTIDGHIRTVVNENEFGQFYTWQTDAGGNQYVFQYGTEYTICGANWENLNVRMPDGTCRSFPAPLVNFPPEHENLITFSADLSAATLDPIDVAVTDGNEYILRGELTDAVCDLVPLHNEIGDAPVFGKMADGTWVQWDHRMRLLTNTPDSLITNEAGEVDGGGTLQLSTGGSMLCSNVPRTFLNEDSCVLSSSDNVCTAAPMPEIDIELNEANIATLHNLTKMYAEEDSVARYVYAVDGLVLKDLFNNTVPHPCTYGFRSRWRLKDTATEGACADAAGTLQPAVNDTLFNLLLLSSDSHPTLRDIDVSTTLGPEGTLCHASDADPEVEILVDGQCWVNVHPDYLGVFDMTYWTENMTHPGNMIADMEGEPNPIKKWMDDAGSSVLTFPALHPEHTHPITRWEQNYRKFDYLGRLGDSIRFRDLPSLLRRDYIADYFAPEGLETSGPTTVLVCGSPGEVASDPLLGNKFELSTGRDPSWWIREQKEWLWMETSLVGSDQLRQRVAWALAQLLVVVSGAIESTWRKTEAFLVYYDIFVRNAFGNYLDILREVSYSPLMAENLSYLNSRSASYVYETLRRHSFADENYAREIMQLFTIGLVQLNMDGSAKRDESGNAMATYSNEHIMSFARAWTGFRHQQKRGNMEEPDGSGNQIDPMRITADWRDKFPKSDLNDGYIGDGVAMCVDLPDKMHLRKGATYRLIGSSNMPELQEDPAEFATDSGPWRLPVKKLELAAGSLLGAQLCDDGGSGCTYPNTVILSSTVPCAEGSTDSECNIDTIRTVKVSPTSDIYYEYVRPPCVENVFYSGATKLSQRANSWRTMCADPRLPIASEACCATGSSTAQRNNIYDGERMTKDTAAGRCSAMGLFECDFQSVQLPVWTDPDTQLNHGLAYFASNYFWAKDPCLIRVKVKSDNGYAAVVYEPSDYHEKEYHVDDNNRNYFKVYWEGDGSYPSPDNNCGEGLCTNLSGGGCLCDTSVSTSRVFSGMPNSAEEVLSKLRMGALDPVAHDLAEEGYAAEPQTVTGVTAYTINGSYDKDAIFGVEDARTGRTLYFKNAVETVHIVDSSSGFSFRNAPTFMSLVPSEATVRDAQFETEAVLEHYFYQPSTAPFVAMRMIQRLVSSNPVPRYVEAVAEAFRTGMYTSAAGDLFGDGVYGNMGATIAAVLLDREARTPLLDADPSTGALKEPIVKVLGLMRSMEYEHYLQFPRLELWNMQDKIGQMSHEFPSVFSFFLPEHTPNGRIGEAGLVGPEEMLLDMPKTVSLLNGMFSMAKYGLGDCNGGFGNWRHGMDWSGCNSEGLYIRAQGHLNFTSSGSSAQVVNDLATLLTAGRLGAGSRALISAEYDAASDAAEGLRLAQQLVAVSPEFHSTNIVKPSGLPRPPPVAPQATGTDYKAIVYLMFAGGCDSYNMLAPKECAAKDLYSEYNTVREQVALAPGELLSISATDQICEVFGVHENLPNVAQMYNEGDLLFFANTGVMTVPVTKDDYWQLTVTPLFAHNHMQRETMRIDPLEEKSNTGVIGRMSDALTGQGLSVGSFSIDHNSISLIGEPGISSTPFIISQNGVTEFNPAPSGANMSQSIKDLNAATEPDSGYFGETWSEKVLASINDNENLYNTLQGTTIGANFPETWLGRKLRTVAQLISTRVERGVDRDMFYVDIGGFDTHSDVRENLINRFTEVNDAIGAFAQELKDMNVWDMVTTVQTSDFARTLAPNTGDGTDHAWGGNYMFFGGSVAGGQVKGTYPEDLTDDGPLGLGRGRLIPKTPWDAVFNGLAEWVGVDAARMLDICPNKNAFPTGDIFSAADLFVPTVRKQRYLRK